jgi:hypothetical protein
MNMLGKKRSSPAKASDNEKYRPQKQQSVAHEEKQAKQT